MYTCAEPSKKRSSQVRRYSMMTKYTKRENETPVVRGKGTIDGLKCCQSGKTPPPELTPVQRPTLLLTWRAMSSLSLGSYGTRHGERGAVPPNWQGSYRPIHSNGARKDPSRSCLGTRRRSGIASVLPVLKRLLLTPCPPATTPCHVCNDMHHACNDTTHRAGLSGEASGDLRCVQPTSPLPRYIGRLR